MKGHRLPLCPGFSSSEPVTFAVPPILDDRGAIGVIEDCDLGFEIRRVYFLYGLDTESRRGGHAHKVLRQAILALSGGVTVHLRSRTGAEYNVRLDGPDRALYIPSGTWRELSTFSRESVCLVLASELFNENDYIRSEEEFDAWRKRQ